MFELKRFNESGTKNSQLKIQQLLKLNPIENRTALNAYIKQLFFPSVSADMLKYFFIPDYLIDSRYLAKSPTVTISFIFLRTKTIG